MIRSGLAPRGDGARPPERGAGRAAARRRDAGGARTFRRRARPRVPGRRHGHAVDDEEPVSGGGRWGRLVLLLVILLVVGGAGALGYTQREHIIAMIRDLRAGTSGPAAGRQRSRRPRRCRNPPTASPRRRRIRRAGPRRRRRHRAARKPWWRSARCCSRRIPAAGSRGCSSSSAMWCGRPRPIVRAMACRRISASTPRWRSRIASSRSISPYAATRMPACRPRTSSRSRSTCRRISISAMSPMCPACAPRRRNRRRACRSSASPCRVTPGFFLVGLSAQEMDRQRNLGLLITRNWLDLPMVFSNGRRGILALEKGVPGRPGVPPGLRRLGPAGAAGAAGAAIVGATDARCLSGRR